MGSALFSILTILTASVGGPVVSAFVGRHVAHKVTEAELKKAQARAERAETLYHTAIAYLHKVAAWCTANGIADELPEPPEELGLEF